ncbi:hypothetical protein [Erwinia phage Gungnir39]|nr:hypothetical protein [Erwinia phage Gungnir39]
MKKQQLREEYEANCLSRVCSPYVCRNCGEEMQGDGYKKVIHCPNADNEAYRYHEPDANAVYCEGEEQ